MKQRPYMGRSAIAIIALGGSVGGAVGCAGQEIAIGEEGSAINIDRCYGDGTRCSSQKEPTDLAEPNTRTCSSTEVGVLENDSSFSLRFDVYARSQGKVAPDGSIWVLESNDAKDDDWGQTPFSSVYLSQYSAAGVLVGSTPELFPQSEANGSRDYALAVDAAGNAIVTVYAWSVDCPGSSYAPPVEGQDCVPEERTTVGVFDAELEQVGAPLKLRALTSPHVASGAPGTLTIAGTATTYAKFGTDEYQPAWVATNSQNGPVTVSSHGVLAQVRAGAIWMQSNAASAGEKSFTSILDLTVGESGASFLLAAYAPLVVNEVEYWGLSRFDSRGNLLWNRKLSEGNSSAQLVEGSDNRAIVYLPTDNSKIKQGRVLSISVSGKPSWSYFVPMDRGVATDTVSGRTIALTSKPDIEGVAQGFALTIISKDGTRCQTYGIPQSDTLASDEVPSGLNVASPYVYLQSAVGIRRYRLPTE